MILSLPSRKGRRTNAALAAALLLFVVAATFLHSNDSIKTSADSSGRWRWLAEVAKAEYQELRPNGRTLRWAAFGSSHTWGAGMDDNTKAYPYLLSSNVSNLAIRAHGLLYPTKCVSSMVGDKILDVVLIEGRGYEQLVRRLKQRFPDLIIIVFDHIQPRTVRYAASDGSTDIDLQEWAKEHATGIDKTDPSFVALMEEFVSSGKGHFRLRVTGTEVCKKAEELDVADVHCMDLYGEDPIEYIRKFADHTGDDWHHPSVKGHEAYASAAASIVTKAVEEGYPEHPRVEPWDVRDVCENWFEPDCNTKGKQIEFETEGLVFHCFQPTKCALEVRGDEESGDPSGTMILTNPSDRDQNLAIGFMVTGPITNRVYPKTKILKWPKGQNDDTNVEEIVVDPITDDFGERKVHVVHMRNLGKVPPGDTAVKFVPLESGTKNPFRVTAYLITSTP